MLKNKKRNRNQIGQNMSTENTLTKTLEHINEAIKLLENNISKSAIKSYALTGLSTARYVVRRLLKESKNQ